MARSVDEGFETFLSWLTPTATETQTAASHRASIEQCLQANFSMTRFFRSGSFGFGTSVSGYSDVDYFAVVPPDRLNTNSTVSLNAFANVLRKRFPNTNITLDAPAVVIPFGTTKSERHEIIPAFFEKKANGFDVFGIPNRYGSWMRSSPEASGAIINQHNLRLSNKAKGLIRLLKTWKYYNAVPLRSFYIELLTEQYLARQTLLIFKIDVHFGLAHLVERGLAEVIDPTTSDRVAACELHDRTRVLAALQSACNLAVNARDEEGRGNIASAFALWNRLYSNNFPGYY